MRSSTFKAAGCVVFIFCLSVFAQNPIKKTGTSTISGKVTLKGNGVAGIPVGARGVEIKAREKISGIRFVLRNRDSAIRGMVNRKGRRLRAAPFVIAFTCDDV